MLNTIWTGMILLALIWALLSGRTGALSAAIGNGAQKAVETAFLLVGGMCFWSGLMRIAEKAGVIKKFSTWLKPLIVRLFPEYAKNGVVQEKIALNMAANLFGMGNAATPAGLAAMDEMQRVNRGEMPTKGMILFVVMNTAAFQLIPSSVVMLRASYGSSTPYDIMPHIWLVSLGSLTVGLLVCKLMECIWAR